MNINTNIAKFLVAVMALAGAFTLSQSAFAAGPTMTTMPASGVTQTSMILNGAFSGSASNPIYVHFNWGTTNSMGNTTVAQMFTTTSGTYSATISGLNAGTTYYFRAEGINPDGTSVAVSTLPQMTLSAVVVTAPSVETVPSASNITSSSALVNGFFDGNGVTTSTQFEYSTDSSFGSSSLTPSVVQSQTRGTFSATISGLAPNTTYYYRTKATNSAGSSTALTALNFKTTAGISTDCTYSFNVNPNPVTVGNSVTATWSSSNCTAINVSGGGISSSQLSSSGTQSSPIMGTTTFTLTPTGPNASPESITVNTQSANNTGGGGTYYYGYGGYNNQNCTINSFTSNINPVVSGGNSSLLWSTYNCSFVRVTGPGLNGTYAPNSSVTTPTLTATGYYTLTAYDSYGSNVFATTVVNVIGQSNTNTGTCTISNLSAAPAQIAIGGSTVLTWNTVGCNFVNITSNTPTALNLQNYISSGTYTVSPGGSGTYFLTANGQNSSVASQVYVTVGTTTTIPTYTDNGGYSGPRNTVTTVNRPLPEVNTIGGNALMSGSTVSSGVPNYPTTNLAGLSLAGGSGILPTNLLGWLVVILIIMGIIILTRKMYGNNNHAPRTNGHSNNH